jgi:hypothetical protein
MTKSKKKGRLGKLTENKQFPYILTIGILALIVILGTFFAIALTGFGVTPAGEAGETISMKVTNGRTFEDISPTTDVYIWKTLNVSGHDSNAWVFVQTGKADQVSITIENSSLYYVCAYNKTGYFTRWSILVAGENNLYLYKNPSEAELNIGVFNQTFQDWSGITSENITVSLKIGLEDEINQDTAIVPLFNYMEWNYTRILIKYSFNDTLINTNVSLLKKQNPEIIQYNDSTNHYVWFNTMGLAFTSYLDFEIELDSGLKCDNISWSFSNFADESVAFPSGGPLITSF